MALWSKSNLDFQAPNRSYQVSPDGPVYQGTFVILTEDFQVKSATTNDVTIGIVDLGGNAFDENYYASPGSYVTVFGETEECFLLLGANCNPNAELGPNSSSQGIPVTSEPFGAIALEGGKTGYFIRVRVVLGVPATTSGGPFSDAYSSAYNGG